MVKLNAIQEQGISIVPVKIGECSLGEAPWFLTTHDSNSGIPGNAFFLSSGPIESKNVNELLAKVLCLPPSLARPLSAIVHNKTGGIILFILRFLASLNDEGDLWFSMSHRRWMYNLEQIRQKEIQQDVVSHMTEQMKNLSRAMQMG